MIFRDVAGRSGVELSSAQCTEIGNHVPGKAVPFAARLLVVLGEFLHDVLDEGSWSFHFSAFSAAPLRYLKLCFNFLETCPLQLLLEHLFGWRALPFVFCVRAAHEKQNFVVGRRYINNHTLSFLMKKLRFAKVELRYIQSTQQINCRSRIGTCER